MTQPDWSKAPKVATHWGPKEGTFRESWYVFEDGVWAGWSRDMWIPFAPYETVSKAVWNARVKTLIPRPAKPRWRYHWGGEIPVTRRTLTELLCRDGSSFTYEAGGVRWNHRGTGGDIIAYRLPD